MARSRTSGKVSAAEQSAWTRGRGNPGGARSESEKQGQPAPPQRRAVPRVTPEAVRAFLTGDEAVLRALLTLDPWDNDPLVDFDADPAAVRTEGDRRARDYRRRLITWIERRGGLRVTDLDHADDGVAGRAWEALGRIAGRVGIDAATWDGIRKAEEEASDGT